MPFADSELREPWLTPQGRVIAFPGQPPLLVAGDDSLVMQDRYQSRRRGNTPASHFDAE